ncbi:MAG: hypothetical protein E6K53_17005 [Gammaproteobacteria bacterium]|nr:MAG: hypothetical protein E6K53_17005 [Gammaproteobacteria bacterium]
MSSTLTAADFENLPDHRMTLAHGEQRLTLDVANEPFAITLRDTGARQSLRQGNYRYEHPVRGALDLFTVPLGPDGKGMVYEITFN